MQKAIRSRRLWAWVCVWGALLLAGAIIDAPVARYVQQTRLFERVCGSYALTHVLKRFGEFPFTCIIAAGVSLLHRWHWRAGAFVAVSNLPGLVNRVMKWAVGRTRPFKLPDTFIQPAPFHFDPFRGGWHGIWNETNLAFASGHAAVA